MKSELDITMSITNTVMKYYVHQGQRVYNVEKLHLFRQLPTFKLPC